MRTAKRIEKNTRSLAGKTVAISGSTGGIGRVLCEYIAALGGRLLLLDRNEKKAAALAGELTARFPDLEIEYIPLDLEDIKSVTSAARELEKRSPDHLILNAGAYSIPRHKTALGFDNVFQINFLSPYYLARRLLPLIEQKGGRIVAVGSIAHNYSKTDPADIDFSKQTRASRVYGNAKRYLMFSLFALDNRCINIAHPGITLTGITAHYPKIVFALIKHPMKVIFMRPKRAALSILFALFCDTRGTEWIGPRLFDIWGLPRKKALSTCASGEANEIAKTAEELYKEMSKF